MRISDWSSDVCSSDLTLPDIDALDVGADFTVFMREGVPNALKQRALRRLWQVDPAFRHICMLDDYNLDYTDAATVVPNLKKLFQVGRGMVLPGEDVEEAPTTEAAGPALPAAESKDPATALPNDGGPTARKRVVTGKRGSVRLDAGVGS